MGKIFINYRRGDSAPTAGRLHDDLARAFGRKNIFMDVDSIPPGVDFVSQLNRHVEECDVFLAIIGPTWLEAKDTTGRSRLDDANDFVATEIAAALARDIPVIPVLIDGARMPTAENLPERLKPFSRRNAVEFRNSHFRTDAEQLIQEVRSVVKGNAIKGLTWPFAIGGLFAMVVIGPWLGMQSGLLPWFREEPQRAGRVLPPPEQKLATLSAVPQPLVSFRLREEVGSWIVKVSLPESATQFGYRIGENGSFEDPGLSDQLDQSTGTPAPKTDFEMPDNQQATTIYITWRDKRGEEAGIFPIKFDPRATERAMVEEGWQDWINFRYWVSAGEPIKVNDSDFIPASSRMGMTAWIGFLFKFRCAIKEARYGYNDGPIDKVLEPPPCDSTNPHSESWFDDARKRLQEKLDSKTLFEAMTDPLGDAAALSKWEGYVGVPPKTVSLSVQLTYVDGSHSPVRKFDVRIARQWRDQAAIEFEKCFLAQEARCDPPPQTVLPN